MTSEQLQEWMIFSELEPFDADRDDQRFGSIVQILANTNRDRKKRSTPYELGEARLYFGDSKPPKAPKKDWRVLKAIAIELTQDSQKESRGQRR